MLKNVLLRTLLVVQQVKDPALSLLWLRFEPWPGNFHMLWVHPKKKKKKKKKKKRKKEECAASNWFFSHFLLHLNRTNIPKILPFFRPWTQNLFHSLWNKANVLNLLFKASIIWPSSFFKFCSTQIPRPDQIRFFFPLPLTRGDFCPHMFAHIEFPPYTGQLCCSNKQSPNTQWITTANIYFPLTCHIGFSWASPALLQDSTMCHFILETTPKKSPLFEVLDKLCSQTWTRTEGTMQSQPWHICQHSLIFPWPKQDM